MNSNHKVLHSIWNQSADLITTENVEWEGLRVDELLTSIFCPGPCYYYVVDFYDRQLKHVSPNIQNVLGLNPQSVTFNDIIAQIHPEDINYVAMAEAAALDYIYNQIGRDKATKYKASYCFRFKTADGSYQLFQHQAITLSTDESGGFAKSLNVHTNINHLTNINNYKATISNLLDEQNLIHIDVLANNGFVPFQSKFSKRETEIIRHIVRGLKNGQVAELLSISLHTVKNHRKNIMQKAGVKTSGQLIARCINEGLI